MEIMSCPSYPSCLSFCNSRHEKHPRNRNSLVSVLSLLFPFPNQGDGKKSYLQVRLACPEKNIARGLKL